MGVLDDMLADHAGPAPPPTGAIDAAARALAGVQAASRPPAAPDLAPLAALDDGLLRRWLRYLPAEHLPALLAGAPLALASRIVAVMDGEAQAWLAAQSDAIAAATPAEQAAAAHAALALVARARAAGPVAAADPPPRPAGPVTVQTRFDAGEGR